MCGTAFCSSTRILREGEVPLVAPGVKHQLGRVNVFRGSKGFISQNRQLDWVGIGWFCGDVVKVSCPGWPAGTTLSAPNLAEEMCLGASEILT